MKETPPAEPRTKYRVKKEFWLSAEVIALMSIKELRKNLIGNCGFSATEVDELFELFNLDHKRACFIYHVRSIPSGWFTDALNSENYAEKVALILYEVLAAATQYGPQRRKTIKAIEKFKAKPPCPPRKKKSVGLASKKASAAATKSSSKTMTTV